MLEAPYEFGVSEYATWPWTFEEDVERYVALGIRWIEVCEAKLDPERALEQLAWAQSRGLKIASVQPRLHSLYPDQPRPEPADPGERLALLMRSIDLFAKAAPGAPLVAITGAAPGGNYREAFAIAIDSYRRLADYAGKRSIRIALEPLNPILMNIDTFVCTIPDVLRIVDAVDRPNFGIWLDVWHIWQDPAAAHNISRCAGRIFGVHVNDWREPRCVADRAAIGDGVIPLAALIRAVRRAGYTGPYTLEVFSDLSLPDSLWRGDIGASIARSREGFARAWAESE